MKRGLLKPGYPAANLSNSAESASRQPTTAGIPDDYGPYSVQQWRRRETGAIPTIQPGQRLLGAESFAVQSRKERNFAMRLTDYKALTFDVYGTLIDWESGMVAGLKPLTDQVSQSLSRDQILEAHAFHESTTQRQTPAKIYSELLSVVYKRLAEEWGVSVSWEECQTYGRSVQNWPAFADSAGALQYLKRYYKLVILSNVDNTSFAYSNKKLEVEFDARYTAEDVGSYKPSPRNFEYMIECLARLGIQKGDILHTAESMFHDHAPANKFGLANCWIYRRHDQEGFGATMNPGDMPSTDFTFNSMADMVKAHQEELSN